MISEPSVDESWLPLPDDRVLVLGASGWFGTTFMDLTPRSTPLLPVASSKRGIFEAWDDATVLRFAPTVVVNFAALTLDQLPKLGLRQFTDTNQILADRMLEVAQRASVRLVLTVSSGAAITQPSGPYARIKAYEEARALSLANYHRQVIVLRAYSVSGPHVKRPHSYALPSFVLQAMRGRVMVEARHPTHRRYTSVRDLLMVGLKRGQAGWSGVIESGGELVEMGELARRVVAVVNRDAVIERPTYYPDPVSTYASDNSSWIEACNQTGLVPENLETQIERTAQGLMLNGFGQP